tara:strand:+ start:364 stop:498 length:135 start_codon:yes stop_codon:yes gene_type:complete
MKAISLALSYASALTNSIIADLSSYWSRPDNWETITDRWEDLTG